MGLIKGVKKFVKKNASKIVKGSLMATSIAANFIPVAGQGVSVGLMAGKKALDKVQKSKALKLAQASKKLVTKVNEPVKALKAGLKSNKQSALPSQKASNFGNTMTAARKSFIDDTKAMVKTYLPSEDISEVSTVSTQKKQSFWDWFIHGKK